MKHITTHSNNQYLLDVTLNYFQTELYHSFFKLANIGILVGSILSPIHSLYTLINFAFVKEYTSKQDIPPPLQILSTYYIAVLSDGHHIEVIFEVRLIGLPVSTKMMPEGYAGYMWFG